jgi:hypothetical protein
MRFQRNPVMMDWQGCPGLAELDAARDFAIMHVQAWYDSFGDHGATIETAPGAHGN